MINHPISFSPKVSDKAMSLLPQPLQLLKVRGLERGVDASGQLRSNAALHGFEEHLGATGKRSATAAERIHMSLVSFSLQLIKLFMFGEEAWTPVRKSKRS
jgi:hypothetical protein